MAIKLRQKQKMSTQMRYKMIAGGASILGLAAYITVVINTANVDESKANIRNLLANDVINNGEVVLAMSWDENPATKAERGNDAYDVSGGAVCMGQTTDTTYGLSAGTIFKDINLKFKANDGLNADGLDISIDYKRTEETGNFYTRGKTFNFGMKDGMLCIKYKLTTDKGKTILIDNKTNYTIPQDDKYRNYRFIFNPTTGKAEVLVDRATIWTNQGPEQSRLTWKSSDEIIIGEGMGGNGKFVPIFDNLIVRKTASANNSPMALLSFTAEMQGNSIMLNWFTAKENGTDYYKIERSTDTKNYIEIGRVKAAEISNELKAYALLDKTPPTGVTYYRLGLTNSMARSIWVPVIAIRVKPETNTTNPTEVTTEIKSENKNN